MGRTFIVSKSYDTGAWGTVESLRATKDPTGILDWWMDGQMDWWMHAWVDAWMKMEVEKCVNSLKAKSNSFILLIFIYSVLYMADIF